jgi:hypothetical protein
MNETLITETLSLEQRVSAVLAAHPNALEALLENIRQHDGACEVLNLKTNVSITLRGPDGEVNDRRDLHNLVTTAGKTALTLTTGSAKYLKDFTYIAIGSNSTAAALADTTLGTELARGAATLTNPATNSIKFAATFAAGTGTGTIAEYGVLSASSGGTLLNRLIDG